MSEKGNDAWGDLSLDDEPQRGNQTAGGEAMFDEHGSDSAEALGEVEQEVLDVEASDKKPRSKAPIYAGIAIAGLVAVGAVYGIGMKLMSVLNPPSQNASSMAAADVRPLDVAPQADFQAPPMGVAPGQPAMPPGMVQEGVGAFPPATGQVGQPPEMLGGIPAMDPNGMQVPPGPATQPTGGMMVGQDGQPPMNPPGMVAGVAPAVAPVQNCDPALAGKDLEIADLKRELDDLKAKLAVANAKPKAVAKAPQRTPQNTSTTNRVVRAKPAAPESQAALPNAPAQAATEKLIDGTGEGKLLLTSYRIYAIYPNTGDYKAAHLVDGAGRPVVVRVGDNLRGARVTRIDSDNNAWRVVTTEGEIR